MSKNPNKSPREPGIEVSTPETEDAYRKLVERAKDGIVIIQDGLFKYVNPAFSSVLGYTAEELLEQNFLDFLPQDIVPTIADRYLRRLAGEDVPSIYDAAMLRKDGKRLDVEINVGLLTYQGSPAVSVVVRDISERKRAGEELRHSEGRYRLLADNLGDVVFTLAFDGKITYVSPSVSRLRGYTPEEAIGQTLADRLTPDSLEITNKFLSDAMGQLSAGRADEFGARTIELEQYRKDGTTIWTEVNLSFQRDDDGAPVGFLGITRDISERRRILESLREAEEMYRVLVESSLVGVYMIQDDRYIYVNPRFAEMFGYTQEEVIGMIGIDLAAPENRKAVAEKVRQRLSGEVTSIHYTPKGICKDGRIIDLDAYGSGVIYRGKPALLGTMMDITARRRAQEKLQDHADEVQAEYKKLKAVTEQKTRFFRNMSHELRTPMTSIVGFTEMVMDDIESPLSPSHRTLLAKVSQNSYKLLGMINDLLDLSRIESGSLVANIAEVNVNHVLDRVVGDMMPLTKGKELRIVYSGSPALNAVLTDEEKLGQIVANLIVNAIKFTPSGQVAVTARAVNRTIEISVQDTGVGVETADLERIFDEFHTGTGSRKGKAPGAGLGLAISKRLCEFLGGTIDVTNEVGKGSTFTVRLPNRRARPKRSATSQ